MAKSQRLFDLVNLLRGRRTVITARALAEVLEVSERTIYRDIAALMGSGVQVEGEAGVGYRLRPGADLPPLMFEHDEMLALLLGLRLVTAQTDSELAAAATGAERRIRAILPDNLKRALEQLPYHVPVTAQSRALAELHGQLRGAALGRLKLEISYSDQHGVCSDRIIWPLAILGWGDRWTVLGFCELRQAYRNFRLDRIAGCITLDARFETGPNLSYQHYIDTELCSS